MFQELGDGVFRRRYPSLDENVGIVLGDDGVLVVDTRSSHADADMVSDELSSLTSLPVRWVVNTHWHWDHVFGNSRFAGAEIWGHVRAREVLLERPDEMRRGALSWLGPEQRETIEAVEIVPPGKTFSDRVSLDIGRQVDLSFHGLGHTDSDTRIVIPGAGVAFLGDLVEEGAPPSFGDSYPLSWSTTLVGASVGIPDVIVPGHGDVVDRRFLATQVEELKAVAGLAASCIDGERTVDDAARSGPYPEQTMTTALHRALEVGVGQSGV
ncbi:MAG: MBL fold metallo-hydrolase [Actinobacteria bacterium]|nr:MBL fold metallo-hydrolase [Actinomycetota bacterium]